MQAEGTPAGGGLNRDAIAALVLLAAAIVAIAIANSGLSQFYFDTLALPVSIGVPPAVLTKPLLLWINDGLMAIFFLLVGLEIKHEMLSGALSNRRTAALPAIAAIGGMAVPALIYISINRGDPAALNGWAIPAATDIAFAVGVLALLGSRVPPALKIFLLALAIIDDLGAIIIIALFYTHHLSVTALLLAASGLAVLAMLNRSNVMNVWPYVLVGIFIWVCVLKSGVHATLAGVATAFAIPLSDGSGRERRTPGDALENALENWVSFAILPLFALANAGVSLAGLTLSQAFGPIPLGIALGLFAGKAIGIYGFARLAISSGAGELPKGTTEAQVFGAAILGGIGFTMSLFIGTLAFPNPELVDEVRIGVLTGSLASAITGYVFLKWATAARART